MGGGQGALAAEVGGQNLGAVCSGEAKGGRKLGVQAQEGEGRLLGALWGGGWGPGTGRTYPLSPCWLPSLLPRWALLQASLAKPPTL